MSNEYLQFSKNPVHVLSDIISRMLKLCLNKYKNMNSLNSAVSFDSKLVVAIPKSALFNLNIRSEETLFLAG